MSIISNRLSIVCASHNNEKKLNDTLISISKNTRLPYEIIICTTSNEYLKFIDIKLINLLNIKIIISKIKSQTLQRKQAIDNSQGNIILQTDDDLIFETDAIDKMYQNFINNIDKNIIVGGLMKYPNKENVYNKFTNFYNNNLILRVIYLMLNGFKKVNDMSIIKSGRAVQKFSDMNTSPQWMSSFLMYKKKSFYKVKILTIKGKGYYEDIFFTHFLYNQNYTLKIQHDAIAYLENTQPTGINTYCKVWYLQLKFVLFFKKNLFLFLLDTIIFTFIHLAISIANFFNFNIYKK